MNDGTGAQQAPQNIARALEQLQVLQIQQAQQAQQKAPSSQDIGDSDLMSVVLSAGFGGSADVVHPDARSSASGARPDPLEAFQMQDVLHLSATEPQGAANGDGGNRLKRPAPIPVATPHVTHEELRTSLSSLSSRLQEGFKSTLGKATAELNSIVSTSVGESLHELQQQFNAR